MVYLLKYTFKGNLKNTLLHVGLARHLFQILEVTCLGNCTDTSIIHIQLTTYFCFFFLRFQVKVHQLSRCHPHPSTASLHPTVTMTCAAIYNIVHLLEQIVVGMPDLGMYLACTHYLYLQSTHPLFIYFCKLDLIPSNSLL